MPDSAKNNTFTASGSLHTPGFRPLRLMITVLILLVLIGLWSRWYAQAVSIPRYCEDPQSTIQYLQQVINEERPAGENARRPYLIAAKLLFLLPRQSGEDVSKYLERVSLHIRDRCH